MSTPSDERPAAQSAQAAQAAHATRPVDGGPQAAGRLRPAPARTEEVRIDADEAHRVIARALELQDLADGRPAVGLSRADLQEIGRSVGVEPDVLARALREVRSTTAGEGTPSLTERVLGPLSLSGATVLPDALSPTQVRIGAERWMTEDEGLRRVGGHGDGSAWRKDPRILAGIRQGLGVSRAEGVLRGLDEVRLHITDGPAGTEVHLEADTRPIRRAAVAISSIGTVASIGLGIATAAVVPETAEISSDLGQFLMAAGVSSAGALATAGIVVRTWRERVAQALSRALDGIAMTAEHPDAPAPAHGIPAWRRTAMRWLGGE